MAGFIHIDGTTYELYRPFDEDHSLESIRQQAKVLQSTESAPPQHFEVVLDKQNVDLVVQGPVSRVAVFYKPTRTPSAQ